MDNEFRFACFVFFYVAASSLLLTSLVDGGNPIPGDLTNYYDGAANNQPMDISRLYSFFASDMRGFAFVACFLPSILLCIFTRFVSSQRACLMVTFLLPFGFMWHVMAQIAATMFFIMALWCLENKKRTQAVILSILMILAHRYAFALVIAMWVAYLLPIHRYLNERALYLAVYSIVAIFLIIGGAIFHIGLPSIAFLLAPFFIKYAPHRILYTFILVSLACFFLTFLILPQNPQDRAALTLVPLMVFGLAVSPSKEALNTDFMVLICIAGVLLLIAYMNNMEYLMFISAKHSVL